MYYYSAPSLYIFFHGPKAYDFGYPRATMGKKELDKVFGQKKIPLISRHLLIARILVSRHHFGSLKSIL